MGLKVYIIRTPSKTNMEPENAPLEREKHLHKPPIFPSASKHLVKRYLDPNNIPKTPNLRRYLEDQCLGFHVHFGGLYLPIVPSTCSVMASCRFGVPRQVFWRHSRRKAFSDKFWRVGWFGVGFLVLNVWYMFNYINNDMCVYILINIYIY